MIVPSEAIHQNNTGPVIDAVERLTKLGSAQLVDLPGTGGHKVWRDAAGNVTSIKNLIDEYAPLPGRVRGTEVLHDLPSFLAECERWKGDALTVYVNALNPDRASIVAVTNDAQPGKPHHRDHTLIYNPPTHPNLTKWKQAANWMNQAVFADFIEDRLGDVRSRATLVDLAARSDADKANAEPLLDAATRLELRLGSQADLLTVSRGLDANVGRKVVGRVNLQNGAATFNFEENVDTGPVVVPSGFVIEVPVFNGSPSCLILARLRFMVKDGLVQWRVLLHDMEHVYAEAVEAIRAEIAEANHRVVLGTP